MLEDGEGGHYWKKKLENPCLFLNINQVYKVFSSCGKIKVLRFINTGVHKFSNNLGPLPNCRGQKGAMKQVSY